LCWREDSLGAQQRRVRCDGSARSPFHILEGKEIQQDPIQSSPVSATGLTETLQPDAGRDFALHRAGRCRCRSLEGSSLNPRSERLVTINAQQRLRSSRHENCLKASRGKRPAVQPNIAMQLSAICDRIVPQKAASIQTIGTINAARLTECPVLGLAPPQATGQIGSTVFGSFEREILMRRVGACAQPLCGFARIGGRVLCVH
jgi:hypothetical protein